MCVPLRTKTNNGEFLSFDERNIGVFICINFCCHACGEKGAQAARIKRYRQADKLPDCNILSEPVTDTALRLVKIFRWERIRESDWREKRSKTTSLNSQNTIVNQKMKKILIVFVFLTNN